MTEDITRRDFVKQTVVGAAGLAGASTGVFAAEPPGPIDSRKSTVAALGSVFIPSRAGDPGYLDLESYGITDYVLQDFPAAATLEAFNTTAQKLLGKAFVDLDEKQREEYLGIIADGGRIADPDDRKRLQTFYQDARRRILSVYYSNYPEHQVPRNATGEPVLSPGDTHQITNPNTDKVVTGWDVAGYKGPLRWDEEEQLRATAKKTLSYWYEGDLVALNPSRPPAATATRTSSGHDYYDVLVLGGGGAGCIVAGRIAERGVNPKTGDRLRVAMIEGGDDWTIRDPGIRPGHGHPIRRRMFTNIEDGIGPEGEPGPVYRYPDRIRGGPSGYNYRIVGGCSIHYGGTLWIPGDEDFQFYRDASGVNWDLAKFGDAIQEVREFMGVMTPPDAWWTKSDHVWADAGRALGYEIRSPELAYRNPLGIEPSCTRYDTKGTTLPWAYIGLNNGLKVIANSEVVKIIIEGAGSGRPTAIGAVYKDKAGTLHEVRAARVICACATNWTPLLLYKSGYGPRELLGTQLLVENKNVGHHMTGDFSMNAEALLEEPITPAGRAGEVHGPEPWVAIQPRPWPELSIQIRGARPGRRQPDDVAIGSLAPAFGWPHKEYMRNGSGSQRWMSWGTHLGAIPWKWRVLPGRGEMERYELDAPRVNATIKQTEDIVRAWLEKLAIKPAKVDLRAFNRPATFFEPRHVTGTARAGTSRENSVCTSDFDCHDIDHLLFTSAATIPRTFFWSMGPTAVNACYGWRRMVANHFSSGCSTKGFA